MLLYKKLLLMTFGTTYVHPLIVGLGAGEVSSQFEVPAALSPDKASRFVVE